MQECESPQISTRLPQAFSAPVRPRPRACPPCSEAVPRDAHAPGRPAEPTWSLSFMSLPNLNLTVRLEGT